MSYSKNQGVIKYLSYHKNPHYIHLPLGFWDGVAQIGKCGCGEIMRLNENS